MSWPRTILHVDMDAFFASVEQREQPALRGRPVLVGHDGPRGVVAAASYEARVFGCRSAMPIATAKRLCPQAAIVPVRHALYQSVSDQVFAIFLRFTPVIEPLSIDEAFLDVGGVERLHGNGPEIAAKIKAAVCRDTALTCSVGVAPNKFLAKLASDMNKPDGLVVLSPEEAERLLPTLPVERIYGIGPKTAAMLQGVGVHSIADLRHMGESWVKARLGSTGGFFWKLACGQDDRPVCTDEQAKSIGHEETFETDMGNPDSVKEVLFGQVEAVAARLRRHRFKARRVHLKIRFGDFVTLSRSRTLDHPTDVTLLLWHAAASLFDAWAADGGFRPVRLIGMSAEELSGSPGQLSLFADTEESKHEKVDAALDAINRRFGKPIVYRGGVD